MAEGNLNFVDSPSVSWAITDDPLNDRYDLEAFAAAPTSPPCRFILMAGNVGHQAGGAVSGHVYALDYSAAAFMQTNDITGSTGPLGPPVSFTGSRFKVNLALAAGHQLQIISAGFYSLEYMLNVGLGGLGPYNVLLGHATHDLLQNVFTFDQNWTPSLSDNIMQTDVLRLEAGGTPFPVPVSGGQKSGVTLTTFNIWTRITFIRDVP